MPHAVTSASIGAALLKLADGRKQVAKLVVTSASIGAALLKLFDARGLEVVGVRHIRLNRGGFIEAVKVGQARVMRYVASVSIGIVFLGALGAQT